MKRYWCFSFSGGRRFADCPREPPPRDFEAADKPHARTRWPTPRVSTFACCEFASSSTHTSRRNLRWWARPRPWRRAGPLPCGLFGIGESARPRIASRVMDASNATSALPHVNYTLDAVRTPRPASRRRVRTSRTTPCASAATSTTSGSTIARTVSSGRPPRAETPDPGARCLILFVAIATVAGNYFAPSVERISARLGLSEDVAGATILAPRRRRAGHLHPPRPSWNPTPRISDWR